MRCVICDNRIPAGRAETCSDSCLTAHEATRPVTPAAAQGALGWPLVPSTRFPGESTLACPRCGSRDVTLSVRYPVRGTGPGGRGRMGDQGAMNTARCGTCSHGEVAS